MSLLSVYERLKPKPPELLNNPARVLVREGLLQLWSEVDRCVRGRGGAGVPRPCVPRARALGARGRMDEKTYCGLTRARPRNPAGNASRDTSSCSTT